MADKLCIEFELKCQILAEIIPTLICSKCGKVPSPDKESNKRYVCVKKAQSVCQDCIWAGERVTMDPLPISDRLFEILPWYCKNYSNGCREIFSSVVELEDHQKSCVFRLIPCIHQFVGRCNAEIVQKNWLEHMEQEHHLNYYDWREPEEIAEEIDYECSFGGRLQAYELEDGAYWPLDVLELGYNLFAIQRRIKNGNFCAWIICLESEIDAKNFEYSLSVKGPDGEKVTFEGPCSTPENFRADFERKGLYFNMTTTAVEYFDSTNGFEMEVKITNMKELAKKAEEVESGISSSDPSDSD